MCANTQSNLKKPSSGLVGLRGGLAGPTFRLIRVVPGANLAVKNVTLQNGLATPGSNSDDKGGAIFNIGGTVSIFDSVITNNVARLGAGIESIGGNVDLRIENSRIVNNGQVPTTKDGGRLRNGVGGQLTIINSTFFNALNLGSNGNVPVAILSSSSFDAATVLPTSVTLVGPQVAFGMAGGGRGNALPQTGPISGNGGPRVLPFANGIVGWIAGGLKEMSARDFGPPTRWRIHRG